MKALAIIFAAAILVAVVSPAIEEQAGLPRICALVHGHNFVARWACLSRMGYPAHGAYLPDLQARSDLQARQIEHDKLQRCLQQTVVAKWKCYSE